MAIPLVTFIISMCLVGIKQEEKFFRPLWSILFVVNFTGAALLILGIYEINFPGTISSRVPIITSAQWKFIGITFFLFPISLIVTVLRFPFRLVKWIGQ
ncbi:MAG: hypothetical protein ACI9R3_003590 [Verrucomicrobiales bacterium]|jgi:hypothetical protein